jgi:predicted nucleic acid-binding protein
MPEAVVDSSVIVAIVTGEPRGAEASGLIDGFTLLAPDLLVYEVANVAWQKLRRTPELLAAFEAAFREFERLDITLVRMEPRALTRVALNSGLTGYDAALACPGFCGHVVKLSASSPRTP